MDASCVPTTPTAIQCFTCSPHSWDSIQTTHCAFTGNLYKNGSDGETGAGVNFGDSMVPTPVNDQPPCDDGTTSDGERSPALVTSTTSSDRRSPVRPALSHSSPPSVAVTPDGAAVVPSLAVTPDDFAPDPPLGDVGCGYMPIYCSTSDSDVYSPRSKSQRLALQSKKRAAVGKFSADRPQKKHTGSVLRLVLEPKHNRLNSLSMRPVWIQLRPATPENQVLLCHNSFFLILRPPEFLLKNV